MDTAPQKNKDLFCKKYISEYLRCVKINNEVFGEEHGASMCNHIKDVIDYSGCDISTYTKKNVEDNNI